MGNLESLGAGEAAGQRLCSTEISLSLSSREIFKTRRGTYGALWPPRARIASGASRSADTLRRVRRPRGAKGSASEGAPRAARCCARLLIRTRRRGIPGLKRKRLRPRSTPIKKGLVASLLATPRPGTFVPKVVWEGH